MLSRALFFCFISAASGQIKWVETGALNRCGDNLCAETEVCLRPRHYLYPFVCFDAIAVPCLKSGLPLSNCYYSDQSTIAIRTTDSTTTRPTSTTTRSTSITTRAISTKTRQTSTTTSSSTILPTDATSPMSTTTQETSTIQSTESSSPTGASQASTLAIHLGLNLHTAVLAGGFILLFALICGMAIALLCFLKKVHRLEERQAPMEMQPVITSFRNDAYRASAAYEFEDIPLENQQGTSTYF